MRVLPILLATSLLAGCTAGRDYAGPPASPAGQSFARAGDLAVTTPGVARWWEALGDPLLDRLEADALAGNPEIAAADARVRAARATLRLERANQAPTSSASALYAHARIAGLDFGEVEEGDSGGGGGGGGGGASNLNLFNLGADASWELDLAGGRRRTVEAARAGAGAAEANAADVMVRLSAEVATTYVNLRERQRRAALGRQAVALQEQMLALLRQRADRGAASALDVARAQGQLEGSRADLVPIGAELDAYRDALATLTGRTPGALDALLEQPGAVPLPPAAVAVGDPAALLQRRPDIRAAERTLAQRNAQVGVAKAARFPRISFLGIIGLGGTSASDLTNLDNFNLIAAPMLSWSFLDFGRAKARVTESEARRDEAEANYRTAVLTALRDAEGGLSRFRNRRLSVATFARAEATAATAARLVGERERGGTATRIDLYDAQRQELAAAQTLSLATAQLTGDFIALQKALGLGWSPAGNGSAGD